MKINKLKGYTEYVYDELTKSIINQYPEIVENFTEKSRTVRDAAVNFYGNLVSYEQAKDLKTKKELIRVVRTPKELLDLLVFFKNIDKSYLYDSDSQAWYAYGKPHIFVWSLIKDIDFYGEIDSIVSELFPYEIYTQFTKQARDGLLEEIKLKLRVNLPKKTKKEESVFINKPFNTKTRQEIKKCNYKNYITTYSPLPWNPEVDETKDWDKNLIKLWLDEKFQTEEQIEVFRAICNVIFHSNRQFNLEFFVEIYGGGKTGKSTLVRLMETLVGENLVASSSLKSMKDSNFEKSKIINKHLILLNEQEQFVGDSGFLKAATGGDLLTIPRKYKDSIDIRNYGVIIITTNNTLIFTSAASAIMRRRISFHFEKAIDPKNFNTNLITFDEDKAVKKNCDWYPHLSGFLDWVLTLNDKQTIKVINDYISKTSINPDAYNVVWWFKNQTCPFKGAEILLHSDKKGPALYHQYVYYCQKEGLKPVSATNFLSNILRDFSSAFPGYKVETFTDNNESGLKGLTYQIELGDHLVNWREAWKAERGEEFFGKNVRFNFKSKDKFYYKSNQNEIQDSIISLEEQIKSLIYKAPQGIYSLIGNPASNVSIFNEGYNKENISGVGLLPRNEEGFFMDVGKKKHKEIFIEFLNGFDFNEDAEITSEDLYILYTKFMHKKKLKTFLSPNQIKTQTYNIWNKHFHKKIKKKNNIGSSRKKGIQGLIIKEQVS